MKNKSYQKATAGQQERAFHLADLNVISEKIEAPTVLTVRGKSIVEAEALVDKGAISRVQLYCILFFHLSRNELMAWINTSNSRVPRIDHIRRDDFVTLEERLLGRDGLRNLHRGTTALPVVVDQEGLVEDSEPRSVADVEVGEALHPEPELLPPSE
jgi:hypothetical protein